jgi:hypothetical protein
MRPDIIKQLLILNDPRVSRLQKRFEVQNLKLLKLRLDITLSCKRIDVRTWWAPGPGGKGLKQRWDAILCTENSMYL